MTVLSAHTLHIQQQIMCKSNKQVCIQTQSLLVLLQPICFIILIRLLFFFMMVIKKMVFLQISVVRQSFHEASETQPGGYWSVRAEAYIFFLLSCFEK